MVTLEQAAKDAVEQLTARFPVLFLGTAKREVIQVIAETFKPLVAPPQASLFNDPMPEESSIQRNRILAALKRARSNGMTNIELNEICLRYGARIYELRQQGYGIKTRRETGRIYRTTLAPAHW